MRRRDFITVVGSTGVAWPLAARAQQRTPVVGFLRSTPAALFAHLVSAFRLGLRDVGFIEGRNVAIEYRWANNNPDLLRRFAADLVHRQVDVIVANSIAAKVAKSATSAVPIVFVTGDDPVSLGLVASLSRPDANLTGVTFFGGRQLTVKRLELLVELNPTAEVLAILADPNFPGSEASLLDIESLGRALGRKIVVVRVGSEREFENAFAQIAKSGAGALLVGSGPFLNSQRRAVIALAKHAALPTVCTLREFAIDGGLMSYAASTTDAYRLGGRYAGRILKGAKPADLPVQQPTRFELIINLKTAKALGIAVPPSLLVRADEVIE
jgi:putative ABC transport system substrate-binding protein